MEKTEEEILLAYESNLHFHEIAVTLTLRVSTKDAVGLSYLQASYSQQNRYNPSISAVKFQFLPTSAFQDNST